MAKLVSRPLSMRKVPGSKPGISIFLFFFLKVKQNVSFGEWDKGRFENHTILLFFAVKMFFDVPTVFLGWFSFRKIGFGFKKWISNPLFVSVNEQFQ